MITKAENTIARPPRSRYVGCLVGQALAARRSLVTDVAHAQEKEQEWPHEIGYTQFVARNYILNEGELEPSSLWLAMDDGLFFERGMAVLNKHGAATSDYLFRGMNKQGKLRLNRFSDKLIGGPGVATHILAAGLVNWRNMEDLESDVTMITEMTHRYWGAYCGALATAIAVSLAATKGRDPGGIIAGLMERISAVEPMRGHGKSMVIQLECVRALLQAGHPTSYGIKKLGCGDFKTALEVVPAAIYASLNGEAGLGWEHLMKDLNGLPNYKLWAIAGAIRGAMIGFEDLPIRSVRATHNFSVIMRNAIQLHKLTFSSSL